MARKVLIADDDRVLVELVASRLRRSGFDVSIAFDNVQAFMMATRIVPDVVVPTSRCRAATVSPRCGS